MSTPSFILANDALARHQKQSIELIYNVTGAKAGKFAALQKQPQPQQPQPQQPQPQQPHG